MRVLVVRDFSKKFYPIRNCFGVFKNQQLPKKFVFCQNMREREECSYQNACLFSHSITEMAIWQIQKQSKSQWSFLDSFQNSNARFFNAVTISWVYFLLFNQIFYLKSTVGKSFKCVEYITMVNNSWNIILLVSNLNLLYCLFVRSNNITILKSLLIFKAYKMAELTCIVISLMIYMTDDLILDLKPS